jgi:hypothetical protein
MAAEPIIDNTAAEFKVKGIVVMPPRISETDQAGIGSVDVEVGNATVRDMRTSESYRVAVIGKARKISGREYEVTLKLQGGRIPLNRGQVKGNVELKISATATAEGATSRPRLITKTVSVSN